MTTAQTSVAATASVYTLDQVKAATKAASRHPDTTDADIRRLFDVQYHMTRNALSKIDNECLGDEMTVRLLDFHIASK